MPTRENAGQRISTGRWNGSGAGAAETFVHEVGHTQGRRHVRCSGGEAGVDTNYPHQNGRIGVWGFGIYDFELRTPTGGRDYMTYCSNEWVSDYGWEQTLDVIEVAHQLGFGGAPAQDGEISFSPGCCIRMAHPIGGRGRGTSTSRGSIRALWCGSTMAEGSWRRPPR